nr:hypothetical protein [Tanacetum cinerariifolium]
MDTRKNIVDLEAFRKMLHISPRVPGQSFAELPFEQEILEFLWFLGHSAQIKTLTDVNNTQQYGAILPIELTTEDIRNTKAYKEYYACATGEAAPKPKASAKRKIGGSDSSTTPPTAVATPRPITTVAAASRLTAATKGKQPARAQVQLTPQSTDERTGSKPGVLDVPSDDSKEEISWNSFDDEDVDDQDKGRDDNEGEKTDESDADDDDQDEAKKYNDDDEEEIAKIDKQEATESGEGDDEETVSVGESEEEERREEEQESFDPIPRTPEDDEDDGNGEEDQGLRISEEERIKEKEETDELYHDVNINQGRGLQVSQDIEDSHVTLTPVYPDGQQKSSSVSSFVTSMLNPISDAGVESIFMTVSSSIAPLPTPTPIMIPSTIATITTSSAAPFPPTTIPSAGLENLPTFDLVFRFEDRVKSLEVNFLEFMQTNQFSKAVSKIPADLTEMELKKIIIEKMEGNKEDVGMMMIKKDPPLDQTGGRRDEEKVGNMNQLALYPNQQPEVQAGLQQGLNLDRCQPASLLLQRNLCRLPVRWTKPHIWCLTQEFWATAKLRHNSICFKIDTRKSVLDLEAFREMLHISPIIPNQPFADLPTGEEILDFLRFLGYSHDIRYLTDVNVNKLYQPWRSFASVINKCLRDFLAKCTKDMKVG